MITENPAAVWGGKSYCDLNTEKTRERKKERMAGISVVLRVCKATGALLGKVRRKTDQAWSSAMPSGQNGTGGGQDTTQRSSA